MGGLSAFSGVFNTKKIESHVFVSDDVVLISMNLNSFTKNSCYEIYAKLLPSLQVAFPTIPRIVVGGNMLPPFLPGFTILDLIDLGSETENDGTLKIYYDAFNNETKKYDRVDLLDEHDTGVINYLYALIDYFQNKQKGEGKYDFNAVYDDEIKAVQTSLQKCIKIYVPKKYILQEGKNSDGENLDQRTILIKLFFQKQEKRSDKRIMSQRGGALITDIPRTPAGTQSSNRLTNDFQQDSESNIGSLIPPVEDGIDNPKNPVSAPMRMHWNSTDKVWEAGTTQVLARLLTDIDAAPITNVVPPQAMGGLSNSDFFDSDSSLYMGGFTTGLAIPLSMHQGNPNKVGPNIIECGDKLLEKVRAVNRSAKSFSAGEQVLLNYINGEWLISSIGEATAQDLVAKVFDWSFAKYIVNSDSFFKDSRYFDSPEDDAGQLSRSLIYNKNILPEEYETISKYMFYNSDFYLNEYINIFSIDYPIKKYNSPEIKTTDRKDMQLSKRYLISTIFDQLPPENGGFIDSSIQRLGLGGPVINIINPKDPYITNDSLGTVVFPFWGPVFTDGYKTKKSGFYDENLENKNDKYFFSRLDGDNNNVTIDNLDKLNVPAETTSKIIDSIDLYNNSQKIGTKDSNIVRTKFCYTPFYESEPVSRAKISFMPLCDVLVGHVDQYSILASIPDRNYHKLTYNRLFSMDFNQTLFGSLFFNRYSYDFIDGHDPTVDQNCLTDYNASLIALGDIQDEYIRNVVGAVGGLTNSPTIPYDCYIKRQPTNVPLGTPRYYRASPQGAECVGVTAGSAKIRKVGGGELNFQTSQYFGLGTKDTVTQQEGSITILPIGPGIGWGHGGGVSERSEKQWGSSTDDIDAFGTTALHVRVFDSWPENQTLFDPRYFSVLHFNPCGNATEEALDSEGQSTHDGDPNFVNGTTNSIDKKNPEAFGRFAKYERKGLLYEEIHDKYIASNLIGGYDELYMRVQGDDASVFSGLETLSYGDRPRYVDIEETSVDIREPTFDEAIFRTTTYEDENGDTQTRTETVEELERTFEGWQTSNGVLANLGTEINSKTSLRPFTEWRINPIRRGQLLSGGDKRGFIYKYLAIGLNAGDIGYYKNGTGFSINDEFDIGKGAFLRVSSVGENGELLGFSLSKKTDLALLLEEDDPTYLNGIEPKLGTDFLPSDFTTTSLIRTELVWSELAKKCYRVTIPSPGEDGESAVIEFYSGIVWQALGQDKPPKEHGSTTRLTLSSNRGERATEGVQDTSFQIDSNNTGFYDTFFFFHNDITHTVPNDRPFMGGFLQYVNLTIT